MPEIHLEDTIAAVSTPLGEGGIAVIRISGPDAIRIAEKIFCKKPVIARSSGGATPAVQAADGRSVFRCRTVGPAKQSQSEIASATNGTPPRNDTRLQNAPSHTICHGYIIDQDQNIIDEVLISVFRKPNSYTAEDVVEISGHGGSRVIQKVLDLVLKSGARHAEPGEFTRRAFLNGRMDLTQAEAVLDLIRAKTDKAVEVALRQLNGNLSNEIHSIKDEIMKIYAHLEAYLDFPDEHLEIYSNQDFKSRFEQVRSRLQILIDSFQSGEILREGASVILCGRPNVGKSSLLNVFLKRDRALVSEVPGTTRDTIEESVELGGILVRLVDTAGLWASQNPIDQAAMERTKHYFEEGDLILWVLDAEDGVIEDDLKIFEHIRHKKTVAVINKIDLMPSCHSRTFLAGIQNLDPRHFRRRTSSSSRKVLRALARALKHSGMTANGNICYVSAKTREGIDRLEKTISNLILEHELGQESILITRLRHKRALENSLEALQKSFDAFSRSESLEFIALDLKQSLDSLKELVGEIYTEDLLDVIFKEFCIGK